MTTKTKKSDLKKLKLECEDFFIGTELASQAYYFSKQAIYLRSKVKRDCESDDLEWYYCQVSSSINHFAQACNGGPIFIGGVHLFLSEKILFTEYIEEDMDLEMGVGVP